LAETVSSDYSERTEKNVLDSDGTLILTAGKLVGGTQLTSALVERHGKPSLVVDLISPLPPVDVARWLSTQKIRTLNVAGPRESEAPGIATRAADYLRLCVSPDAQFDVLSSPSTG
jgi:hypothetical protein